MLITEQALIIDSLIMRKILDALTILTTVLVLGILGGGFFTYKYVQSPQFQKKIMDKVLGEVQGLMPDVLGNALPDVTGKSMPVPVKPTLPKMF
jgi:hypothetical protein